jgi:hypothetical protein
MNLGRHTETLTDTFMVYMSPSSYLELGRNCFLRYLAVHCSFIILTFDVTESDLSHNLHIINIYK